MNLTSFGAGAARPSFHQRRQSTNHTLAELDSWAGRSSVAAARPPSRIHAIPSATTVEAPDPTARPPCYQEVWLAPEPSRLVKDKRAFLEQHRSVHATIWHQTTASLPASLAGSLCSVTAAQFPPNGILWDAITSRCNHPTPFMLAGFGDMRRDQTSAPP
jgi:hypothetical protein